MTMRPVVLALALASASAFAPTPITIIETVSTSQTVLRATLPEAASSVAATTSRRQLFQTSANAFTAAAAAITFSTTTPTIANAADNLSYFTTIEKSTNALSDSLGHAVIVIDGLNAQASRLGSSPHPAHPIAVLDGMHAQARRLTRDITRSRTVLDTIQSQAKEITRADENYKNASSKVSHAASVLDGILAQSIRLEGASSWGGSEVAATNGSTDEQIIYMLSVLDGLNAQVKRLNLEETLGALDEMNARAARALL